MSYYNIICCNCQWFLLEPCFALQRSLRPTYCRSSTSIFSNSRSRGAGPRGSFSGSSRRARSARRRRTARTRSRSRWPAASAHGKKRGFLRRSLLRKRESRAAFYWLFASLLSSAKARDCVEVSGKRSCTRSNFITLVLRCINEKIRSKPEQHSE